MEQYIQIEPGNSENEHTLTIKSDNNGSLICESILAGSTRKPKYNGSNGGNFRDQMSWEFSD